MNKCKTCNTELRVNPTILLTPYLPQKKWYCPKCSPEEHKMVVEHDKIKDSLMRSETDDDAVSDKFISEYITNKVKLDKHKKMVGGEVL